MVYAEKASLNQYMRCIMEELADCEISYEQWQKLPSVQLIDIRERDERMIFNIGGEWIPLASITYHTDSFSTDKPVILYCQSGRRSFDVTKALRQMLKRNNIYSLKRGSKKYIGTSKMMVYDIDNSSSSNRIPNSFILRRLHSLTGVFLALYLFEHLLTNAQAARYLGENGQGFIDSVNWIHSLPFLKAIEILLLGVPIAIHLIWGIRYLFTGAPNSFNTNGTKPALPEYPRNHAYTWQRITSWILVFGLIGHVIQMRFIDYPDMIRKENLQR